MNQISKYRVKKGLSQLELGLLFSKPKDSTIISRWERGIAKPNLEAAIELSKILEQPVEKIFPNNKTV